MFKEFKVGEHVYLCIKPNKTFLMIGSFAKMAPRYCRPFDILVRNGIVEYPLAMPPTVKAHIFFIFHFLRSI